MICSFSLFPSMFVLLLIPSSRVCRRHECVSRHDVSHTSIPCCQYSYLPNRHKTFEGNLTMKPVSLSFVPNFQLMDWFRLYSRLVRFLVSCCGIVVLIKSIQTVPSSFSILVPINCPWSISAPASGLVKSILGNSRSGRQPGKLPHWSALFPSKSRQNRSSWQERECSVSNCDQIPFFVSFFALLDFGSTFTWFP